MQSATVMLGSATKLVAELAREGVRNKRGKPVDKGFVYKLLHNRLYRGEAVHKGQSHPGEHQAIISAELWDKVHAILGESPRKRAGSTRAQTPALLKGIIFGPTGHAMVPSHTRRGCKLYRYYVSTAVLKQGRDACPVGRVPAGEVEAAVIGQVRRLLTTPEVIVRTGGRLASRMPRSARARSGRLCPTLTCSGMSCSRPSRLASSSSWWSGWTSTWTGSASGSGRRG